MSYQVENTVIHLIGAPGTGKYTIAREMLQLAKLRLVDNHLINNPLFTLLREDGKTKLPAGIWDNVAKIWAVVADTMVNLCPPHTSFVLTNALFEHDNEDRQHMQNMHKVAAQRKGVYVPVRLLITDTDEHVKRITHPARNERMKETDPAAPQRYAGRDVLKTGLATEMTLDVTHTSATDAAHKILAHAQSCKKA